MKKLLCALFALVLMASTLTLTANAMPAPHYLGDANGVGGVDVRDATFIQKYVAKLLDSDPFTDSYKKFLADISGDGKITIQDATMIQKDLANIEKTVRSSYPDISYRGFYADYDSGKAMAGVPVTFTAVASSVEEIADPLTYEFYVEDELVEKGDSPSFTYTFAEEGCYVVNIRCINGFGYTADHRCDFEVVKPYESEKPVIKAFYPDQHTFYCYGHGGAIGDVTYTAEVIFGTGDYQYQFLLDGKVVQEYSEKNTYVFTERPAIKTGEPYVLTVRVKDSSTGDNFVSQDYRIWAEV